MKPVLNIVYGASGHGKVVCDILLASNIRLDGFVDDNRDLEGKKVMGFPVLGSDKWIAETLKTASVRIALGIGNQQNRKIVADRCQHMGAEISTLVHPRATVAASAQLGEGTVVMAGAVVNPDAKIGRGVIINTGAVVEHDVVVGDYAHLSPGVTTGGGVRIGSLTHIGLGATILPGISIGQRTVVGAGAVVVCDIPDDAIAFGVPAKLQSKGSSPVQGNDGSA